MRKSFIFALPVLLLAAGAANAEDNKCESAVKDALANKGVEWSSLKNVQWDADKWNSGRGTSEPTVSGYQFYAEPEACSDGSLVAEMDNLCGISDIYTRGKCRIEGVAHWWW